MLHYCYFCSLVLIYLSALCVCVCFVDGCFVVVVFLWSWIILLLRLVLLWYFPSAIMFLQLRSLLLPGEALNKLPRMGSLLLFLIQPKHTSAVGYRPIFIIYPPKQKEPWCEQYKSRWKEPKTILCYLRTIYNRSASWSLRAICVKKTAIIDALVVWWLSCYPMLLLMSPADEDR